VVQELEVGNELEIAVRQTQGKANTEDLRQAMIHYRTLFEELVGEPELVVGKTAA
jgi:hypothetical protein